MEKRRLSGALAVVGAAALILCILATALNSQPTPSDIGSAEACGLAAQKDGVIGSQFWAKPSNRLTLHYVWPKRISFGHTLCLIVSGAVPADAKDQPASVPLSIFLNNLRAPQLEQNAKPVATPQTILVQLKAQEDASQEAAEFWRELLHSDSGFAEKTISVGLARSATDSPEVVMNKATVLVVFYQWIVVVGGLALLLLIASFVLYASQSSILRDGDGIWTNADVKAELEDQKAKAEERRDTGPEGETDEAGKARIAAAKAEIARLDARLAELAAADLATVVSRSTFSLAKSQMAFWLILSTIGFVFIWLSTGQYQNLITAGILVLLGISSATGLAAVQLTEEPATRRRSGGFLADILADANGPQLYRLQSFIWTVILGVIFVWHVAYNFRFVDFDNNLLILMGISQSLYLGFKARDSLLGGPAADNR